MRLTVNPATGRLEPSPSVTAFLTKSLADTYYYPLSTNPAGYLTSTSASSTFLKLDGSNENTDLNIGNYKFTTRGLDIPGNLITTVPNPTGATGHITYSTNNPTGVVLIAVNIGSGGISNGSSVVNVYIFAYTNVNDFSTYGVSALYTFDPTTVADYFELQATWTPIGGSAGYIMVYQVPDQDPQWYFAGQSSSPATTAFQTGDNTFDPFNFAGNQPPLGLWLANGSDWSITLYAIEYTGIYSARSSGLNVPLVDDNSGKVINGISYSWTAPTAVLPLSYGINWGATQATSQGSINTTSWNTNTGVPQYPSATTIYQDNLNVLSNNFQIDPTTSHVAINGVPTTDWLTVYGSLAADSFRSTSATLAAGAILAIGPGAQATDTGAIRLGSQGSADRFSSSLGFQCIAANESNCINFQGSSTGLRSSCIGNTSNNPAGDCLLIGNGFNTTAGTDDGKVVLGSGARYVEFGGGASPYETLFGNLNINSTVTTFNGTSGNYKYSMPLQGTAYKKFIMQFNAYTRAFTHATSFPVSFSSTPIITANNTTLTIVTLSSSSITIPISAAISGWIVVEGF